MSNRVKPLYLTGFAGLLRRIADRIDDKGAPHSMSNYTFTFERGEGIRFREDGRGCRLWYLGMDDYERAHAEADKPAPRVDWAALAKGRRRA
ncbi:hypothetical protein GCM10022254_09540 [Actinomadura meridiana]|uniref:Uncharacterized protein n=1 Tax=Actinomadura meridiana TaxID=559626 RepID=A0ABP8BV13_9ACTN